MAALHVVDPAGELHLTAVDRLAEKVGSLDLAGNALGWPVERLVGGCADLEFGQDVGFDDDGLLGRGIAQRRADFVVAVVHLVCQLEGPSSDTVLGGGGRLAEYLVALGVGHGHLDRTARGRMAVERVQGQGADEELLAGLVDRLVGGQQYLVASLDGDRLLQSVPSQVGPGFDDDLLGRVGHVGDGEFGGDSAVGVGGPFVEDPGPSPVLRLERDLDAGTGNGFGIAVTLNLDTEHTRCARNQPALSQDERVLVANAFRQTEGVDGSPQQPAGGDDQQCGEGHSDPRFRFVGHHSSSFRSGPESWRSAIA